MPIGIHEGSSVIVPTLGSDRPFNPLILHAVSHSVRVDARLRAAHRLRRPWNATRDCVSSSWSPRAAGRPSGSSAWTSRRSRSAASARDMTLRPSEYFARQCAISFEVDERTLPALVPFVGAERIVWGSDYPHHDATFPGAVDAIRATVAPCPTATQAKVLGLNARRLYRLPSRRAGPAGLIDDYFAAVTAQRPRPAARVCSRPTPPSTSTATSACGHDAILRLLHRARPSPTRTSGPIPGPCRSTGTTVTVDIDVHLGGADRSVRDVFETDGERITALRVRGFADALRAAARRRVTRAGRAAAQVGLRLRRVGAAGRAGGGPAAPPSPRRARAPPRPT